MLASQIWDEEMASRTFKGKLMEEKDFLVYVKLQADDALSKQKCFVLLELLFSLRNFEEMMDYFSCLQHQLFGRQESHIVFFFSRCIVFFLFLKL